MEVRWSRSRGPIIMKTPLQSPAAIDDREPCNLFFFFRGVYFEKLKKWGETAVGRLAPICYRLVTFAACKPLGPEVTSNSTAWPSFNDLYPSA